MLSYFNTTLSPMDKFSRPKLNRNNTAIWQHGHESRWYLEIILLKYKIIYLLLTTSWNLRINWTHIQIQWWALYAQENWNNTMCLVRPPLITARYQQNRKIKRLTNSKKLPTHYWMKNMLRQKQRYAVEVFQNSMKMNMKHAQFYLTQ